MSRSTWKVPYLNYIFFSNFFYKQNTFNIFWRNSCIPNILSSTKFKVYNGIWFLSVIVKSAMVGLKFGEFSITKQLGKSIHNKVKRKSK